MVKSPRPAPNGFVRVVRTVYNPLGFSKGYNFVLWFLTIGYLMGFTLARISYLDFYGVFCSDGHSPTLHASPGECFWYGEQPYKVGIMLHLFTILPAAFLACFQFVPVIRHKVRLFHRINGYLVVTLSLIADAGAIIVSRHAFGGDFATQSYVGLLVIITTLSYVIAYINIKTLQIDQHRAWMMRTWAYFSTIVTLRLIMFSAAAIISISNTGDWELVRRCDELETVTGPPPLLLAAYPACASFVDGTNPNQKVIVAANLYGTPAEIAASSGVTFGTSGWLALILHALAIELYLHLTPAESDRLRQVSYERQLERGFKHPGYAGLTAERLGDANVVQRHSEK